MGALSNKLNIPYTRQFFDEMNRLCPLPLQILSTFLTLSRSTRAIWSRKLLLRLVSKVNSWRNFLVILLSSEKTCVRENIKAYNLSYCCKHHFKFQKALELLHVKFIQDNLNLSFQKQIRTSIIVLHDSKSQINNETNNTTNRHADRGRKLATAPTAHLCRSC